MLIEIKINRNTKKERPFKNLNICILASPLALASAFTSTFQIFCFYLKSVWCMFFTVLDYSVSLCFVANAYYSTISRSSIQSLPLVFKNEGCLDFWMHPSTPVSKKQLLRKFLEICW